MQGQGDGLMDIFVSGDHDSSMLHYSAHVDYEVLLGLFPLVEFNGFTTIGDGNRTAANLEGIVLFNFGNTDSGTVLTIAGVHPQCAAWRRL